MLPSGQTTRTHFEPEPPFQTLPPPASVSRLCPPDEGNLPTLFACRRILPVEGHASLPILASIDSHPLQCSIQSCLCPRFAEPVAGVPRFRVTIDPLSSVRESRSRE